MVTPGCRCGEYIHVDAGASKSIFKFSVFLQIKMVKAFAGDDN